MSAPTSPPWTPGSAGSAYRRHFRYGGSDVRVSDAERTEVADQLSRHYQDGRLDQAEFNERLDRAMNAKTRADFTGLFADLPELPDEQAGKNGQRSPAPVRIPRHGPRPALTRLLTIAAVVIVAIVAVHTVLHSTLLWLLVAVLAFLWLRNEEHRRRRP
jgi:Flp pilus assembly protein TadB